MKERPARQRRLGKGDDSCEGRLDQAESALRECEERYSRIFSSSPVAIGISRLADCRFIDVNNAFLDLFCYAREEVIGHTSDELGLWANPEEWACIMAELRQQGHVDDMEIGCRRKSGEAGFLLVSIRLIELAGEECFLGTFLDISKRRTIEEAFRENERRYRSVVEDQTEVICRFNSDWTYKFVNEIFCRFFGKTREELLGGKWQPHVVDDDISMVMERLQTLSQSEPVVVIENRVHSGSGEIRWMQFVNRAFFDEDGGLHEIQAVGRDITDRKLAEELLQKSEANYRALFENSLDAIFLTIPDGTIRAANPAACWMFGMTEEELRKAGRAGIIDSSDRRLTPALEQRARTGSFFGELTFIRKDGTKFPAETSSVLLDNGANSFVILRDISERKRAEQELIDRQRKINTMAMERFVAEERERCRIAEQLHDQIAPKLFLAKMKIHSLVERLPPGDYGPAMDAIDALIDLGVEDIRSLTIQLRPPILSDMGLEAALRWLAEEFNENYRLQVNIHDDKRAKPLKYEIRSAIFHIVRELLLNVTKHARTDCAEISIARDNGSVVVTVEDKGIGFDVGNSTFNNPRSGGFGIFNTRMKIEYLGGEMRIDSSLGQGTRVVIRAPLDIKRKDKE